MGPILLKRAGLRLTTQPGCIASVLTTQTKNQVTNVLQMVGDF